jgi:hypothetical protein
MIRISRRGKIGLSALAAVVVAGALAAVIVVPLGPLSHAAHAAPRTSSTVTYTGKHGHVSHISKASTMPTNVKLNANEVACQNDTNLPKPSNCTGLTGGDSLVGAHKPMLHRPSAHSPFNGGTKISTGANAPKVTGMKLGPDEGDVVHSFNGIKNDNNAKVNGFVLTPPDQGLCVGPASAFAGSGVVLGVSGSTTIVLEPVNEAMGVYSTTGTLLAGPFSLATVFNDPFADGDPSCNFDAGTQTFFFTEIGVDLNPNSIDFGQVITDLAVINAGGYAAYQVDTSVGGTCFPDFPHQGYDTHALYITVNQFDCGPASDGFYAGAMVWALSKSQLVARSSAVNFVTFGPLILGGVATLAIAPAFGDASGTEYMVNSFPYDQFGNSNSVANTLGFWSVTGDENITSGSGTVTLTGRIISSETYAFPQPAGSTGTGLVNGGGITSEAFLNPDDSRMEQLQLVSTSSGLRLFTSLDSAVNITGDPSARDGAAWFELDPTEHSVVSQGYVAAAGTYLLYPSILRGSTGTVVIDFSMTSKTLNPSTGYVFMKDSGGSFGTIRTTGFGAAAHFSFSDFFFNEARWGDYSAAALDPTTGNVWVADEYIPNVSTNPFDNWGTRVWEVAGSAS